MISKLLIHTNANAGLWFVRFCDRLFPKSQVLIQKENCGLRNRHCNWNREMKLATLIFPQRLSPNFSSQIIDNPATNCQTKSATTYSPLQKSFFLIKMFCACIKATPTWVAIASTKATSSLNI
jgi:hypothetical protein